MRLDQIIVGDRVRKDLGDIAGLAESIERHGLLHPVVVKADGTLVAGHRRLEAVRSLGRVEIAATVIEVDDLLSAERDENEQRKAFTRTEGVAIGSLIEEAHRAKIASVRSRQASRAGKMSAAKRLGTPVGIVVDVEAFGGSADAAARAVGMDSATYFRAKKVVAAAEADPATFGDLPLQMDETGNVAGTYREMKRRRDDPKAPKARNTVHGRTHLPKHTQMTEKTARALEGICSAVRLIEVSKVERKAAMACAKSIEKSISSLRRFSKELANVKG